MLHLYKITTLSLFLIFLSCSSSNEKKEDAKDDNKESIPSAELDETLTTDDDSFYMIFSKIDNRVVVQMDDSVIYDSKTIGGNPDLNLRVDLMDFYNLGMYSLKVDLYNGVEPYDPQMDSDWRIVYDIYRGTELIEFIAESGSDGRVGLVFSETHSLDDY